MLHDDAPFLESLPGHILAASIAMAVGAALAQWHGGSTWHLAHQATLFALLAVLARDNAHNGMLRDAIVLPGMILGAALTCGCAADESGAPGLGVAIAALGMAVAAVLTLAFRWAMTRHFGREAFGLGDVKCSIMVGAFFGTSQWLVAFGAWATMLAILVLLPLRFRSMPSGSFHLAASLVAAIVGPWARDVWPAVLGG